MLSVSSGVPSCAPGQKNRFVLYANICAYIEFMEEIVLKSLGVDKSGVGGVRLMDAPSQAKEGA
jgi:hypothetical protein